jgi:hypothetical protein
MTPENFERMANLATTTRDGLMTMRARALEGKREDLVTIADRVLRERFPLQAGKEGSQRKGRTPTEVRCRDRCASFTTGKDAYTWMLNEFCRIDPNVLATYARYYPKQKYFSRTLAGLFEGMSRDGSGSSDSVVLANGWHAATYHGHQQKFEVMSSLSGICQLDYEKDWTFQVSNATRELLEEQRRLVESQRSLDALLAGL